MPMNARIPKVDRNNTELVRDVSRSLSGRTCCAMIPTTSGRGPRRHGGRNHVAR